MLSGRRKILLLSLVGAVALFVAGAAFWRARGRTEEAAVGAGGALAPGLVFETAQGQKLRLSDLRGRPLLLNFWAGWCAPCLHEMPGLYRLHEEFKPRGLEVIALNLDDAMADGLAVLEKTAGKPPFPVVKGIGSPLIDQFSVEGLPFTVIVDREHKIQYAKAGELDWAHPKVRRLVEGVVGSFLSS